MKYFILLCSICLFLGNGVMAQEISLTPLFPDFLADTQKLPAACPSVVQVNIQVETGDIKEMSLVFVYDATKMEIQRVLHQKEDTAKIRYRIEDGRVLFTKKATTGKVIEDFSFSFLLASQEGVSTGQLTIATGDSYFRTYAGGDLPVKTDIPLFSFMSVEECDPDTVAPTVTLLSPDNDAEGVPIDTAIRLRVTDAGVGVDWSSVEVLVDSLRYVIGDDAVRKEKDVVTITPLLPLPYGTGISIRATVHDKQKYPKPNTTTKTFGFMTTVDTPLCKELGCSISLGRKLHPQECVQLQKMHLIADEAGQKTLETLVADLGLSCSFAATTGLRGLARNELGVRQEKMNIVPVSLDLFGLLGRGLFVVVFFLKLYYLKQTKKYKKKLKIETEKSKMKDLV